MRKPIELKIPNVTQYLRFLLIFIFISSPILSGRASLHQEAEIILDGIITTGEYTYSQIASDGDFILYWRTIDNEIYLGIEGKTNGWVAIGIKPSFMMLDADMYLGWVNSNGTAVLIDAYATGPTGPHPADIELGGSNDILGFNGSESNQLTIIEFKRLLISPDVSYDNSIPSSGMIKIIWALGASDSFDAPHVKRGSIQWGLEGSSSFYADFSQPIILGFSLFLSLSGLLIFVDSKGRLRQN